MKNENWIVYCHTNKINNKKYVGITGKDVNIRWKNGKGYSSSTHFNSAIQKYGWDNFNHDILFDGLSKQEAEDKERELILSLHLKDRRYGYNLTDGGEGTNGYCFTEEQKKKMSEKQKGSNSIFYGKKRTKEFCEIISKARKGMVFSEKHKKNLSLSHLNKKLPDEQKRKISNSSPKKRKVICLETKQVFDSITKVSSFYNKDARHIGECCSGKRMTWNNLHWAYYEDCLEGGEN